MTNELSDQAKLALALLGLFPPMLRSSVIENEEFMERYGFSTEATVSLDLSGLEFVRSELFGAIRNVLSSADTVVEISSKEGARWELSRTQQSIGLSRDGVEKALPDFRYLSPHMADRLSWFDQETEKLGIADQGWMRWRDYLRERPLNDEEVDLLIADVRATPLFMAASIFGQLHVDTINISALVPSDHRYYERLVGDWSAQSDLSSFAAISAAPLIKRLIDKEPYEGLKRAMLLSAHSKISDLVPFNTVPRDIVRKFFDWVAASGDRFSQLGAIECGLLNLVAFPELEPCLATLVRGILVDDADEEGSRFDLVCSLSVLVYGELARIGFARQRPPFWRRLSALAHASLIERQILAVGGDRSAAFNRSLMGGRGLSYYMRSYIDLREEPRWLPDFILPSQLKAEFLGRIIVAASIAKDTIRTTELSDLLFNQTVAQITLPFSHLPGPLEGGVAAIVDMPPKIESSLQAALEAPILTAQSFASLVNSALIYRIDEQQAQLAAKALRRVRYELRRTRDEDESFALLAGLATVAAVARSGELAREVRILTRSVRRSDKNILPDNELRILLIASASHVELSEWGAFLGDWLTELSFEEMSRDSAVSLTRHIQVLCALEPTLWKSCSKAEAACRALAVSMAV